MKKTNKGFSMVELIIVIAIMAILAGALAPALIKYINKSRISSDIQTANTIATAVQTGLADEAGYDACTGTTYTISAIFSATTPDAFQKAVKSTVGGTTAPTIKASKCMRDQTFTGTDFTINVNKASNTIEVTDGGSHTYYPKACTCLTSDAATQCNQF